MSLTDLNAHNTEADDEAPAPGQSEDMTGGQALVTAALSQRDGAALAHAIAQASPQVILVRVPSPQWAKALAQHLRRHDDGIHALAVTDRRKDGSAIPASELVDFLGLGMHLVLVSHDAEALLPPILQAAADHEITIAPPTVALVRNAVRTVTGSPAQGLKRADFERLDFEALALALRSSSTSADCLRRLRRASSQMRAVGLPDRGPKLEDLPLTGEAEIWAKHLLSDLRRVEAGQMDPSDLPYAVLEGPPGTGKTMMASALARSAGWRIVTTSVSSWFSGSDGYLGGVSKAATAFFNEVLSEPRTIGFIDEADAIPNRAHLGPKEREWWTPFVTLLLLQIDRVRAADRPVLLLGATNFYAHLDASLIRSRRLEHRVSVQPPRTADEIAQVYRFYLQGQLDAATIAEAARFSVGRTPADIESVVRTARARAAGEARQLQSADLLDLVLPANILDVSELRAVALHEAGHAVVAMALGQSVEAVSIVSEGRMGGFMKSVTPSSFPTRDELETLVTILLGGRATDMIYGKGAHAGAEHDLAAATGLLAKGMGDLGLYGTLTRTGPSSALQQINDGVEPVLQQMLRRALKIVRDEQAALLALTDALLQHRILDGNAVATLYRKHGQSSVPKRPVLRRKPVEKVK